MRAAPGSRRPPPCQVGVAARPSFVLLGAPAAARAPKRQPCAGCATDPVCVAPGLRTLRLGLSGIRSLALALPSLTALDLNRAGELRCLELRCPALLVALVQGCRWVAPVARPVPRVPCMSTWPCARKLRVQRRVMCLQAACWRAGRGGSGFLSCSGDPGRPVLRPGAWRRSAPAREAAISAFRVALRPCGGCWRRCLLSVIAELSCCGLGDVLVWTREMLVWTCGERCCEGARSSSSLVCAHGKVSSGTACAACEGHLRVWCCNCDSHVRRPTSAKRDPRLQLLFSSMHPPHVPPHKQWQSTMIDCQMSNGPSQV